jgi:hypothetical protein
MGRGGLATTLRIKLMEVFYVPRVQQFFSNLHTRQTHLRRQTWVTQKGPSQLGESLLAPSRVSTHQRTRSFIQSSMLRLFNTRLPSSFINKVGIFRLELVMHGFIICLDMEGGHGDFWGEDDLCLVHQKERCFSGGPTG